MRLTRRTRVVGILLAASLCACATPKVAVKQDRNLTKFSKVYLLSLDNDPRNVLPKVQSHLTALGFDVVAVPPGEAVGGNQGTGVFVTADGYVLTSGHVIGNKKEATLLIDGKPVDADLVYIDSSVNDDNQPVRDAEHAGNVQQALEASLNSKENRSILERHPERDFALLKIKAGERSFVPIPIAKSPQYQMGQDVYTVGFPMSDVLGNKPRLTKGLINSVVGPKDNPDFVQVSADAQPGNSGGPLLNQDGQLIGLVEMSLRGTGITFAVKNRSIREFLDAVPDRSRLTLREGGSMPLGDVQNSVVQVRAGTVPAGFYDQPKLVCAVRYKSHWDVWYRFQYFDVILYDYDRDEVLLRAGQYGDDPLSTEDGSIDRTFEEIGKKLGR